jgi:septal ring-binding cell division protein DamX
MVATAGGSSDIYVLPATIDGKSCYRVVWGLFDSREAAQRGMGSLPRSVRAGDSAPVAISRFLQ